MDIQRTSKIELRVCGISFGSTFHVHFRDQNEFEMQVHRTSDAYHILRIEVQAISYGYHLKPIYQYEMIVKRISK